MLINAHSPATHWWTQPPTNSNLPTQPQPPPHHSPQPTAGKKKKKKCWSAPITQPPTNEPNHLPMLIYPHKKCWSTMTLTMKWEWMSLRDRRVERVRDRSWESEISKTRVKRMRDRRPELKEWAWERWALEMRRWDESEWERKREWRYHGMYYLNHRGIKIIFF